MRYIANVYTSPHRFGAAMKTKYAIVIALFGACQALGKVLPRYANIHSNIWPQFGWLFLVPGIAVVFLLPEMSLLLASMIAVPLNAVCWWAVARWLSAGGAEEVGKSL